MSAAGYGAIAGSAIGTVSSLLSLHSENKQAISNIKSNGELLATNMRQININRQYLDEELGGVLTANALDSIKKMADAKVIMASSGTVGGTSAKVSQQVVMDELLKESDILAQARNTERGLLTDVLTKQINYRTQANQIRSMIKSPMEAFMGTLSAAIGGASQGAQMGSSFGSVKE